MVKTPGKCDDVIFLKMQFFAFLTDIRKNKFNFWNLETKLDKIRMFLSQNFELCNLT